MEAVRRPYHAGLTREAVVAAAVDALQERGVAGFSLRRLAAHLDVDTMALYKHVRNKDDLIGAALSQVFQDARPASEGEWWERAAHTFREHRRILREHPWALTVLLSFTLESSEPWVGVNDTLTLLRAPLGAAGAARWMRLLAAFTNGFLLTEADVVEPADARQVASDYPQVAAAMGKNARTGDQDFELGLRLVVDGMRAAAAARAS